MGGAVITLATAAAVTLAGDAVLQMWVGLGVVLAGVTIAASLGASAAVAAMAAVPGAVVIALAAPPDPSWVRPTVVALTPLVGFLTDDFETRYSHRGLGVVFFGLASMGTFLAVPDTEWARTLFAVCLVFSLAAWPRPLVALGRAGSHMAAAVFVLITASGAMSRPASAIGALACLGFLVVEPLAVRLWPRLAGLSPSLHSTPEANLFATVPQFALVLACSRVAARNESVAVASTVSLVVLALAFLLLRWVESTRIPELVGDHSDA